MTQLEGRNAKRERLYKTPNPINCLQLTANFTVAFFDKGLNFDMLQRDPYPDMPKCSAANEKNPDVASFHRRILMRLRANLRLY